MATSRSRNASSSALIEVGPDGRLSQIVCSHLYCVKPCRDSRYRKPALVATASIRSVPRWHISMMDARKVGLHVMWPWNTDTAAAGIEPGRGVPEYLASGGCHLGQNHRTMMTSWATTTPIVRRPQTASCIQSISWKSGKPLPAITPPGSRAKSKPRAARIATANTKLTTACLPSRTALPDLTPPDSLPFTLLLKADAANTFLTNTVGTLPVLGRMQVVDVCAE